MPSQLLYVWPIVYGFVNFKSMCPRLLVIKDETSIHVCWVNAAYESASDFKSELLRGARKSVHSETALFWDGSLRFAKWGLLWPCS